MRSIPFLLLAFTTTPAFAQHICEPQVAAESWRHPRRARFATGAGAPHHSTQGPLAVEGERIVVRGKFAYGAISKDLEHERVRLFVNTGACSWIAASGMTDSDGRVTIRLSPLPSGTYAYRLVVPGDGSTTSGTIAVRPRGANIVVFDVDGTLTTDDGEVFEEALLGRRADMHRGAVDVVRWYARQGIQPVYVTGRTYHLQEITRRWLETQGFPPGPLHTTDRVRSSLPGRRVRDYKERLLGSLTDEGFNLVAAYGNASSDICAYAAAGVSPRSTFIIGDNGGNACEGYPRTVAVGTYPEHLRLLTRGGT